MSLSNRKKFTCPRVVLDIDRLDYWLYVFSINCSPINPSWTNSNKCYRVKAVPSSNSCKALLIAKSSFKEKVRLKIRYESAVYVIVPDCSFLLLCSSTYYHDLFLLSEHLNERLHVLIIAKDITQHSAELKLENAVRTVAGQLILIKWSWPSDYVWKIFWLKDWFAVK